MSRLQFLKETKANSERLVAMSDAELAKIVSNGVTVDMFRARLHQSIDDVEDELIDHLAIVVRNGKYYSTHVEI